jgi:hypothetical protein
MGIQLLCYTHCNECKWTHDVIHDTIVVIAQNDNFHVKQKQLHVFSSNMFSSFYWWFNIVLTKDEICTLVNIIIANATCVNFFP